MECNKPPDMRRITTSDRTSRETHHSLPHLVQCKHGGGGVGLKQASQMLCCKVAGSPPVTLFPIRLPSPHLSARRQPKILGSIPGALILWLTLPLADSPWNCICPQGRSQQEGGAGGKPQLTHPVLRKGPPRPLESDSHTVASGDGWSSWLCCPSQPPRLWFSLSCSLAMDFVFSLPGTGGLR